MFVRSILAEVAEAHKLYLDCEGPRKARGGRSKVAIASGCHGNKHDLDYVLEQGAEETRGVPVALVVSLAAIYKTLEEQSTGDRSHGRAGCAYLLAASTVLWGSGRREVAEHALDQFGIERLCRPPRSANRI